jgi:ABC-2 type transport system ATP-binding protein
MRGSVSAGMAGHENICAKRRCRLPYHAGVTETTAPVIVVESLRKVFRVTRREPGIRAAFRSLVAPRREEVVAVEDVSFGVQAGEILGYLGPNGAGKSTTIKMLTGVLVPSAGRARVLGLEPYRDRTRNATQIGVVFGQRTQMWWDLPAVETFLILRHMYQVPDAVYRETIAELDAYLELSSFWKVPVRQLSLGQRMRADLAAAMVHRPPVLFLDEPTVGMDVVGKERIRLLLAHLARERGTTILLTTHDLGDVQRLCKRVLIIDHGRAIYEGDLQTLAELEGAHRRLEVRFAEEVAAPVIDGAELELVDGLKAVYRFPAKRNPQDILAPLAARYPVADLTVESPDFEEIIRLIYERRPEDQVGGGAAGLANADTDAQTRRAVHRGPRGRAGPASP